MVKCKTTASKPAINTVVQSDVGHASHADDVSNACGIGDIGDVRQLLSEYRILIWRKTVLESVPLAMPKALASCRGRIRFTQELVEKLRNGKPSGERLYWVVNLTYMTMKKPSNINEILEGIDEHHGHIPRSSYFRLRGQAIKKLDAQLERMVEDSKAILKSLVQRTLTPCA